VVSPSVTPSDIRQRVNVAASIIELQSVLRLPIIDHLLGVIGFYLSEIGFFGLWCIAVM
jgi:hypothetical protein